jgi:predicted AlkP superfamily pyrophosphatase or phosphodiesterase
MNDDLPQAGQTPNPDMHDIVGSHDIVLITLDTLRYDAAQAQFRAGRLPNLARHLPRGGWELRHTPGTFTYAAHAAFFAGFLPTPALPGSHARLFALRFEGSETTDPHTFVFDNADSVVHGLAQLGYRTICIGGVGFFNLRNPLGSVLPNLFAERYWQGAFSVTAPDSTARQVALASERLRSPELAGQRIFLFINISAIHQPNCHYANASHDSLESHAAALNYVDRALAPLWTALQARAPSFVIVCSDHGTAYGEGGYVGHRHAHQVVMDVPYAHFLIPSRKAQ